MSRGYFGIGIYHGKSAINIGTLWRSANIYGASFIFTIGRRYKKQCSDTLKTWRHIPLYHYQTFKDFNDHRPHDSRLICIENIEQALPLELLSHPERCVYLLGAEDHGLPKHILWGEHCVKVASKECLNVAVAGSIVMYDRFVKGG